MAKEMYYPNEGKTLIKNKITKFEAGQVLIWRTYQHFFYLCLGSSVITLWNKICQEHSYVVILMCSVFPCSITLKKREESLYDHGRLIKI